MDVWLFIFSGGTENAFSSVQINWHAFLSIINDLEDCIRSEEKNKTNGLSLSLGLIKCLGGTESRRLSIFENWDSRWVPCSPAPTLGTSSVPENWVSALSRTFLLNNWLRKSWKESACPEPESEPNSWLITRSALSPGVALTVWMGVGRQLCLEAERFNKQTGSFERLFCPTVNVYKSSCFSLACTSS